MKSISFWITVTTVVIIITVLSVVIPYFAMTSNGYFSTNNSDWSSFGGYVGGVLGPVITIFNLFVLIVLTLKVNEWQSSNNLLAINYQRAILLSSMRQDVLKELILQFKQFELLEDQASSQQGLLRSFGKLQVYLSTFPLNYEHLFPNLINSGHIKNVIDKISAVEHFFSEGAVDKDAGEKIQKEYLRARVDLVEFIQKIILDELTIKKMQSA